MGLYDVREPIGKEERLFFRRPQFLLVLLILILELNLVEDVFLDEALELFPHLLLELLLALQVRNILHQFGHLVL